MRLLLLLLFVATVFSEEQAAKTVDKKVVEDVKDVKQPVEESKSKTEKRDSSDQTGIYNPNDEPFKPMLTSNTAYEVAASDTQQVYYDKNQLTGEESANIKGAINRQAANTYQRVPYSQVIYQQQPQEQYQQQHQQQHQQQQQNKQHLRIVGKNAGIQQNQQNIIYAAPHNSAFNYERNPQQQQQVQYQTAQRGQQKQYVIAIPLSYIRQLQQQLLYQQQQEPSSQAHNGKHQQQQQSAEQQQQQAGYTIAGPLARDHYGAYRPFHRFSPTAVNDVSTSTSGQHQIAAPPPPLIPASPAPPGYVTQYIQIPASLLLEAAQSAQVQQRPFNNQHHQSAAHQQQQQPPAHHQQQQQQFQAQSPQLYYYQPQQQHQQIQQQQHQPQLKQSLTSPPLYEYHIQQQQQQPSQQQIVQHIPEYQHQQSNVGKQQQQHRFESIRPNANLTPTQHGTTSSATYEQEQAQLAAIYAQAQTHLNSHPHAHHDTQPAQELTAPQAPSTPGHKQVPAPPVQTPAGTYEPVVHYNPLYVQHYQQQQRLKYQQPQHPQHRLQIQHPQPQQQLQHHHQQQQQHHQAQVVDNLNYLQYSQGIHGQTPLPFLRLQSVAAAGPGIPVNPHTHMTAQPSPMQHPFYNYNLVHQPFVTGAFQPSYAPLGMPSKVTSFTNVLLQPFVGHAASYQTPEIGNAAAASHANPDSLPFFNHHTGGIQYGTHLYHPPTPATTVLASNKHEPASLISASARAHPAARAAAATKSAGETKAAKASAKASATAGSQTIVKYP